MKSTLGHSTIRGAKNGSPPGSGVRNVPDYSPVPTTEFSPETYKISKMFDNTLTNKANHKIKAQDLMISMRHTPRLMNPAIKNSKIVEKVKKDVNG